ncbi:hypothetical protein OKW45_003722 [Paraburkholderia sp. WSM4175]|uniref:hypothetical protein n=1 Tax=Paraburkholderia sp. WSM4175 TaxID=2991072 RepID=UPI003D1B322B
MNENAYEQSVLAEREHKAASQALSVITGEVLAIEQRISEKSAARAQVVADVRAGNLEEPTAALRLAILDEDVRDLQGLASEAKSRASAAGVLVEQTGRVVRAAAAAVAAYERGVTAQALDRQILDLETKLLRALVERYRASGKRDDSLWNLWSPSEALRGAVSSYRLPQI